MSGLLFLKIDLAESFQIRKSDTSYFIIFIQEITSFCMEKVPIDLIRVSINIYLMFDNDFIPLMIATLIC